jgi:glycerol-3-phosphate acyltransferase PlsX
MKFALDAMGGDHAPRAVVQGVLNVLSEAPDSTQFVLVGNKNLIEQHLPSKYSNRISIKHTSQAVTMEDRASTIIKTKPDSSIVQGLKLVKEKQVEGFISSGNTGAVMTASLLLLGRIPGVKRPAIGAHIPTVSGGKIVCDVGTNPDAKAFHILQFAIMASHYIEFIDGCNNPKIGLINIGEEANKGSELYQEAYNLLKRELPNFIGNIEGRHILDCAADVLVCDGFVGNTVLKFGEGFIDLFSSEIKTRIKQKWSYLLGAYLLKPVFLDILRRYDYEEHGGTPLLGISGISIICHGSSGPKAIKNSILVAEKCVNMNLIENTRDSLAEHLGAVN